MRGAGHAHVSVSATQFLLADFLAGDGFDNVRASDEHLGGLVHHDDEVCKSGGVDVPTRAGAHDEGNLGDNAGGLRVAEENLGIQAQGHDTLVNAGTRAFVDANQWHTSFDGQIHNFDDFLAIDLT